jgi:hypothetical protein
MNQVQTVVNYWMVNTSYTVSISDTVADRQTLDTIQTTLNDAKGKVKDIMSRAQQPGGLIMQPGKPFSHHHHYHYHHYYYYHHRHHHHHHHHHRQGPNVLLVLQYQC